MRYFWTLTLTLILAIPARAQHDPGRDALRLMALGKLEQAREMAMRPQEAVRNSPISDAERHFVLAIIDCRYEQYDSARKHLQEAVASGLPIERILAGPRDLFSKLSEAEEFSAWLKKQSPVLLHGPMLTNVTDRSASFWVRTARPASVQVFAAEGVAGGSLPLNSSLQRSAAENDFTAVVRLSDLSPGTRYSYRVKVEGEYASEVAEFQTFPSANQAARFSIGFGGGAGYTPQFHHMWQTVREQDLLAFLMLGDNVYIDDPEHAITQQYCYYRRQSEANWKSFIRSTSMFAIYDDHDFGVNDCIPGPAIDEPSWKRPVWNVFRQNWNNPAYGGGDRQPGCWFDFQIGDVHFIMLDGRFYRDLKGGSMLGPAQKAWLLQTLKGSAGKFKVMVSPVPWSPGVKPRSKDTWDGFAAERDEIFRYIHQNKIAGVLLMAADRHRTDVRRIPRQDGYDFYEVMSSRLTNVHTHGLVKNAKGSEFILGYNEKCSFGHVTFDTRGEEPNVLFKIVTIDGETVGQHQINLRELRD